MAEPSHRAGPVALMLALLTAFGAGCAKPDEELQRQIVELRADLQMKAKALEEAKAKASNATPPPPVTPSAPGPTMTELTQAKSRVSDLENEVTKLKTANETLVERLKHLPPPQEPNQPISMKFDADVLKDKLEDDLTKKAAELRDLVLRQHGVTAINEISIQRVELPPEVITPFHSAITFTVMDNGKPLRVQFPVTADFGGSWRLPSPDKIQQACQQAREQMASGRTPETETAPSSLPAPPSAQASRSVAGTPTPNSGNRAPKMKRVDSNTFVMDWGDNKASPSATGQPSSVIHTPAPSESSSSNTTVTNAPVAPGHPAPAPPSSKNVPPPVMPVQRDIIIKF
jgi:hypothetical protein